MDTKSIEQDRWIISEDYSLAVSFTKGKQSDLWRPDTDWDTHTPIAIPFDNIVVSPHGKFLAGITADKKLYVWDSSQTLSADAQPAIAFQVPANYQDMPSPFNYLYVPRFSPNDKWLYVFAPEGLYIWPADMGPGENPQPYFKLKPISRHPYSPWVTFSPRGNFFALVDSDGSMYLRRLGNLSDNPSKPTFTVNMGSGTTSDVYFSNDEKWLGATATESSAKKTTVGPVKIYLADLSKTPVSFQPVLEIKQGPDESLFSSRAFQIFFSPDGKWVAAYHPSGGVYVWPTDNPPGSNAKPVIESKAGVIYDTSFKFSRDSKWVAVSATDRSLYLWELDKTGKEDLKPVFPVDALRSWRGRDPFIHSFRPGGTWFAEAPGNGSAYLWKLGESPNINSPAAFLGVDSISFQWCDDDSIFILGGGDVFYGEAGKPLEEFPRQPSAVVGLTELPDNSHDGALNEIVVFDEHHLSFVRRKLYFWNIPLRTYPWPKFVRVLTGDDTDDK